MNFIFRICLRTDIDFFTIQCTKKHIFLLSNNMKPLGKYITRSMFALLLICFFMGCKSQSTMPKRKKTRCNTCPKFSYIETGYFQYALRNCKQI